MSTPTLSWSEILSMIKVELELFSDIDMYFFSESNEVVFIACLKHIVKLTINMCQHMILKNQKQHAINLDKDNLYGYAMSKCLLTSAFKLVKFYKVLVGYSNDNLRGCASEFNLEYPKELCDMHNDYALDKPEIKSLRSCASKFNLEYPKELCVLHNDYASDKPEIKREIMYDHQ